MPKALATQCDEIGYFPAIFQLLEASQTIADHCRYLLNVAAVRPVSYPGTIPMWAPFGLAQTGPRMGPSWALSGLIAYLVLTGWYLIFVNFVRGDVKICCSLPLPAATDSQ